MSGSIDIAFKLDDILVLDARARGIANSQAADGYGIRDHRKGSSECGECDRSKHHDEIVLFR